VQFMPLVSAFRLEAQEDGGATDASAGGPGDSFMP